MIFLDDATPLRGDVDPRSLAAFAALRCCCSRSLDVARSLASFSSRALRSFSSRSSRSLLAARSAANLVSRSSLTLRSRSSFSLRSALRRSSFSRRLRSRSASRSFSSAARRRRSSSFRAFSSSASFRTASRLAFSSSRFFFSAASSWACFSLTAASSAAFSAARCARSSSFACFCCLLCPIAVRNHHTKERSPEKIGKVRTGVCPSFSGFPLLFVLRDLWTLCPRPQAREAAAFDALAQSFRGTPGALFAQTCVRRKWKTCVSPPPSFDPR